MSPLFAKPSERSSADPLAEPFPVTNMLWREGMPIRDPRVLLAVSIPLLLVAVAATVVTVVAVANGVQGLEWWHAVLTLVIVAPMALLVRIGAVRLAWMRRYRRATGDDPVL